MEKQYSYTNQSTEKQKKLSKLNIGLIIATALLAFMTILFATLYFINQQKSTELEISLNNVYERNLSELVDNVNNSQVKLSKVLASDYKAYAKKMLNEISKNTTEAAGNLSSLPINIGGIDDTISFVNQVSGYTQSLAQKLDKGESLTDADKKTLTELEQSFSELKNNINKLSQDYYNGNILSSSQSIDGDFNDFTLSLQGVKSADVDYPTMIYDGPFSDSQVNRKIKNISNVVSSEASARDRMLKLFKNASNEAVEYLGETGGKFQTYDYKVSLQNGDTLFVQMTKNGAELLTVSGTNDSSAKNISTTDAINVAKQFVKSAGIDNMECVWSDVVSNDAYINLAPIVNNTIIYPDLIKVKVDLATGNVLGYEATSFFTNHSQRNVESSTISDDEAKQLVPDGFKILSCKNALAPLEYGREVLCKELKCSKDGDIYYLYYNAKTGACENILRVVDTDDGSLLI